MPIHPGPVFVDANTIIEAYRTGSWAALAARYSLETVEICCQETQTGAQNREPERTIDNSILRTSLKKIHNVTPQQIAAIELLDGPILDDGEQALWAHALTRTDNWLLCGPDRASMKFGFLNGHRAKLISLGQLLDPIGHKAQPALASQYEKKWLEKVISDLVLGVG